MKMKKAKQEKNRPNPDLHSACPSVAFIEDDAEEAARQVKEY